MTKCKDTGCSKDYTKRGYCENHYRRLLYHGVLSPTRLPPTGRSSHSLYTTHKMMKQRCYNPKEKKYKNYGGRGIKVCDRWLGKEGFNNFIADMGERPEGLTLDRINNNGDYEPSNCRWATYSEQSINTRLRSDNKSGYVGVSWDVINNRWRVTLTRNKITMELGRYLDLTDAIQARKQATV